MQIAVCSRILLARLMWVWCCGPCNDATTCAGGNFPEGRQINWHLPSASVQTELQQPTSAFLTYLQKRELSDQGGSAVKGLLDDGAEHDLQVPHTCLELCEVLKPARGFHI